MAFIELDIRLTEASEWNEVVVALLAEMGADSFWEEEDGVKAYFQEDSFDFESCAAQLAEVLPAGSYALNRGTLEDKNWNAEWESQFEPVVIPGVLRIRAPFHAPGQEPEELIIQPKMAFGTGHHQTTRMMCERMLQLPLEGRVVLDMGTGTGILGILAARKGAAYVLGIDNDPWSAENARENMALNQTRGLEVVLGDASAIPNQGFDLLLANINRNIILRDLPLYLKAMKAEGAIDALFSGFYTHDLALIRTEAEKHELEFVLSFERENWCCAHFKRPHER